MQAFVIADHVYVDKATRKHVIAGTFNRVMVPQFPATHAGAWAYLSLSDIQTETTLTIKLRHAASGKDLWTLEIGGIRSEDRLKTTEINLCLPNLTFPVPGRYDLELFGNGSYLGTCRVEAEEIQTKQAGDQET